MKTDNIFYQLFQTLPSVLFELLGEPVEKATGYTFKSVEVKELSKTIDGVFLPVDKSQPIYFVEVQFQKDENLYNRLLSEIFIYLGQYKPDQYWKGVVIYAQRSLEPAIIKGYEVLFAQNLIQIIYLDEIAQTEQNSIGLGIIDLVVGKEETAVEKVKSLTETTRRTIPDLSLQIDVIELIERIIIYKFPDYSSKELEAMFGLAEWKQTQFYKDVVQEGEAKGKAELTRKFVANLLKMGMNLEQITQVTELSIEEVQALKNEIENS